jgi:hypothetical protein
MKRLLPLLALAVVAPSAPAADGPAAVAFTRLGSPTQVVIAAAGGRELFAFEGSLPAWSPDGERLAFTYRGGIATAGVDGSGLRVLTSGASDLDAAWSPDGARIAWRRAGATDDEIWVMNADGSAHAQLTADGGAKTGPRWSPTASRLAWSRRQTGSQVFVADVPGAAPRSITPAGESDSTPDWSPDGNRLAVLCLDFICVLNADGSNRSRLTRTFSRDPDWSPDGTRVAYTGTRLYPELGSRYGAARRDDVFVVAVATGAVLRLTGAFGDEFSPFPQGASPAWSPDGSRLLFASARRKSMTSVMDMNGRCEHPLGGERDSRPVWRPGATRPPPGPLCVDLRLSVRTDRDALARGQGFAVSLHIENDGTGRATGIQISGVAPDRVPATIPPAESADVRGFVRAGRPGALRVTPRVTAHQTDADPETNELPLVVLVLDCTAVGTAGNDVLVGTARSDRLCGRPGADRLSGLQGDDLVDGGSGNDTLLGGAGRDRLVGGGGRDVIVARDGERDTIDCGTERDTALVDRLDVIVRGGRCDRVVRR